jgi:hypothetical protein
MPLRSQIPPAARACLLATAAILMAGCGRGPERMSRSDSLALAASGGVRTDSGAVPLRIGHDRRGDLAQGPEWVDNSAGSEPDASYHSERIDGAMADAQHEIEMQVAEAVAEAQAQSEAEVAAAMSEMHDILEQQRSEIRARRHARRMAARHRRDRMRH